MPDIKDLDKLLKPHVSPGTAITGYTHKNLTQPGENYGSLMLALEVELKNSKNEEEVLNIVAKLIPENKWLRKMFKVEYTFPKEMNFYAKVIPSLIKFQLEQGMENTMDIFPKFYGGRLNLNPGSSEVDEDGIILLENLKLSGYVTVDRRKGFDKELTEFILKDLAGFHAVPVALKINKPKVFEAEIMPHVRFVRLFESDNKQLQEDMIDKFENFAKESDDCKHLVERMRKNLSESFELWGKFADSPFSTITHNDYWVNNTMIKFDNDGKPVSNKLVDFQAVDYGSPGKDVVFFIFSSVQTHLVEQYYDHFLQVYYDKFIETLRELDCDTSPFTFEGFEKELEASAKSFEFFHCMVMTKPIFASPHAVKDLKDIGENDMVEDHIPEEERGKSLFVIREFGKRNWI